MDFGPIFGMVDRSIPSIVLIGGVFLLLFPFLAALLGRTVATDLSRRATFLGIVFVLVGIGLALVLKSSPQVTQPQTVINLNPQAAATSVVSVERKLENPEDTATAIAVAQDPVQQPTATTVPAPSPIPAIPTDTMRLSSVPPTPLPSATVAPPTAAVPPTPQPVTYMVSVPAYQENGVAVKISSSGIYRFSYAADAYSPWPNESFQEYRGWSTLINLFVNSGVKWGTTPYGLQGPVDFTAWMGTTDYYATSEQANAASMGQSRTFALRAGDYMTLVVVDERGQYSDNRGKVDVAVTYYGPE